MRYLGVMGCRADGRPTSSLTKLSAEAGGEGGGSSSSPLRPNTRRTTDDTLPLRDSDRPGDGEPSIPKMTFANF